MSEPTLINIGELSRPATVLIEKVSSAIGILYEPSRIRREAEAKADASLIEAEARIQIGELEKRALTRFVVEQTREQQNIEDITTKALPNLNEESDPSKMDEDWISDFFSKCRRVSSEEMQVLWASLLAGEANKPGSVSKRTVDFVAAMDKTDAEIFTRLCQFTVNTFGDPLIFDLSAKILDDNGITWSDLSHLDTIGLIQIESLSGYIRHGFQERVRLEIAGESIEMRMTEANSKRQVGTGKVMLTRIGREMRRFVNYSPARGLYDHCVEHWFKDKKIIISTPYPRIKRHYHAEDGDAGEPSD